MNYPKYFVSVPYNETLYVIESEQIGHSVWKGAKGWINWTLAEMRGPTFRPATPAEIRRFFPEDKEPRATSLSKANAEVTRLKEENLRLRAIIAASQKELGKA